MKKIKEFFHDYKMLFRSVPGTVTTLFCISVVVMNLMANKIIFNSKFIACDGGFLLSWVPFLCMDIITKHYGPKAATKMNIFALIVNLFFVGIFALVSFVQIDIGEAFQQGNIYDSFNSVFRGSWYILLSSSTAFLASGVINNFLNYAIGKMFKKNPDGRLAYVTRSYVSTFVGQFCDNLIFAVMTFMLFTPIFAGYGMTFIQCLGSAIVGALLELLMEVIFSPIGYRVVKKWQRDNVGSEYLTPIENTMEA